MLKILFELLSKKSVSATYLAKKYGCTTRTIYRYLETMEGAGIPLYTIRGNGGGISIIDTYRLTSTFMTIKEFEQVLDVLQGVNDNVSNKVLDSAITKLKATIKNEYTNFNVKNGNLIFDAGTWGDTAGYKNKLNILQSSIDNNAKLEIVYHDRKNQVTTRVIEPHIMVFKQGLWYTYAYCELRKTFRFFKTGRIASAKILNEKFLRRNIDNKELPLDFWSNVAETKYVELEIKEKCLSEVMEWLGIENIENENNRFFAKVKLPYDDGLIYKILSFGDGIIVQSPKELKEEVKQKALNLLENYR